QSVKHADDLERRVARCWANNPAPYGGECFEPYELVPAVPTDWCAPADLWSEEARPADLPVGIVPDIVERVARDRARKLGIEPGALASALLTSLGSLVPAGNRLQMRQ